MRASVFLGSTRASIVVTSAYGNHQAGLIDGVVVNVVRIHIGESGHDFFTPRSRYDNCNELLLN